MLAEFSFLRHPLEKIMRFGRIMVPGIARMDVIYLQEDGSTISGRTLTGEMEHPYGELMDLTKNRAEIEKFMSRKYSQFEWISKDDLPWNSPRYENVQKDLLRELEENVLIVPFQNQVKDKMHDLVLFYFNKNLSNLHLTSSVEVSKLDKHLAGAAYANSVRAMVQCAREDRDMWEDFAPAFVNSSQRHESVQNELRQMRRMYQERLVASCKHYLEKLSREYGRNYEFSLDAMELISKFEGEYFKLENAIKSGVRIANNLHIFSDDDVITIEESYLNFNTTRRIEEIHDTHVQTEMEKPFNYLNTLEGICEDLQRHNQPLTAKNVAQKMKPEVKPAAITMYLNSKQDKILRLFNFYPDKWKILRTGFRPIFNILENARKRASGL